MPLLTQNSELRPHHIFNFAIPAWHLRVDGKIFKTCPNAGTCATVCYARNGTYMFPNVLAAHTRNLLLTLNEPAKFADLICEELTHRKFQPKGVPRVLPVGAVVSDADLWLCRWVSKGGAAVRVHDSGDFYSLDYLRLWFKIAWFNDSVLFYAYTKEVAMLKEYGHEAPPNFRWLYSTGGLQDDLITETDRRADVFPDEASIAAAGHTSQDASDLLAILLPTNLVGIPANNIPHFNKKLAGRRFSELRP